MKSKLIIFLLLSLAICASSQSIAPILLGAGTNGGESGDATIFWTAGEMAGATLIGSENLITQGFWQPELKVFTSTEVPSPADFGIVCTPNPVSDDLHISYNQGSVMDISLYSIEGRKLYSEHAFSTGYVLHMASWPAAVYLLRFTTQDGAFICTQKIVKQ